MTGLTLEDLLAEMNDKPDIEKTASADPEDATYQLVENLKSKVEEDMKDEILIKKASKAADVFGELVTKKIEVALSKLASEDQTEKIANLVVEKLIEKLAVDTDSQTLGVGSDPVPKADPQTSVEAEAAKKDPKAQAAQAKKENLLERETIQGASAEGKKEEKVANLDDELVQKILAALNE